MSAHGFFTPPLHDNEPVRSYAPGTPERAELQARLRAMEGERISIPMIIGGKDVHTDETFEAVMPHRKSHVLADVAKGGPEHVQQAIDAAKAAHADWSRMPWHERAAVFLRAAELLSGPWRSTLNAATMLNQSKTSHQAEIDAVCEMVDFWRYNVDFLLRVYAEQPHSPTGIWNRMEYRPLEGFVLAVSPFNFSCIGGNLSSTPALMGCTIVWKPASTAALSAYYYMRLLQAAGLPDGVINLVYGSGSTIGSAAVASPDLAGIHFTGSTEVFNGMWETVGANVAAGTYHGYPRLVGETGGKDFILAHPSADAEAVATAVVRGSFEYQGQKCSAASRLYVPSNLWPEVKERLVADVATIRMGDPADFENFMGAVIDASAFKTHSDGDRGGASVRRGDPHRRLDRRLRGLLRRADDHHDGRQGVPAPPRRALRPDRDHLRLRREALGRHAPARRRDRAVRADGRGVRDRALGDSRTRTTRFATPPGTSTSTTSRPGPSSASSRSAARARAGRTTRPARCGTSSAG